MNMAAEMRAALAWRNGEDTGLSSQAIMTHMVGLDRPPWGKWWTPADPSDFGRCFRLLERFPVWRLRLPEMARYSPEWAALVAAWDELEALWLEERDQRRAPKLYARMQAIEDAARATVGGAA